MRGGTVRGGVHVLEGTVEPMLKGVSMRRPCLRKQEVLFGVLVLFIHTINRTF